MQWKELGLYMPLFKSNLCHFFHDLGQVTLLFQASFLMVDV